VLDPALRTTSKACWDAAQIYIGKEYSIEKAYPMEVERMLKKAAISTVHGDTVYSKIHTGPPRAPWAGIETSITLFGG
jgi:hypothetical protein